jgi:hypothetical protein
MLSGVGLVGDGTTAGGDTVWLTYASLAERLGVEVASAQRRALRARWTRQPGNDGRTLVLVPLSALTSTEKPSKAKAPDIRGPVSPVAAPVMALLQARLEAVEAALEAKAQELAEVREDRARMSGELDGLRTATEHLHEVAATARREADEARRRSIEAEAEAARAKHQQKAAEVALARLSKRGWWSRLRNSES